MDHRSGRTLARVMSDAQHRTVKAWLAAVPAPAAGDHPGFSFQPGRSLELESPWLLFLVQPLGWRGRPAEKRDRAPRSAHAQRRHRDPRRARVWPKYRFAARLNRCVDLSLHAAPIHPGRLDWLTARQGLSVVSGRVGLGGFAAAGAGSGPARAHGVGSGHDPALGLRDRRHSRADRLRWRTGLDGRGFFEHGRQCGPAGIAALGRRKTVRSVAGRRHFRRHGRGGFMGYDFAAGLSLGCCRRS